MNSNPIAESLHKNVLGLFDKNGDVSIEKTVDFLEISRAQLAKAFGLTSDQLRPDRIGPKTKAAVFDIATALEYVAESFDGNVQKTKFWIKTPNLNFGGTSPLNMILRGRQNQLLKFIFAAKSK